MNFRTSRAGWTDCLPQHWGEARMRFVATINPSKSELAHKNPVTVVSFLPMEAVGEDGVVDLTRTKPMTEVATGYTYFRDFDVLVAKITPCFENGKAARVAGLRSGIGFGSTEFHVLRARSRMSSGFLLHLAQSPVFRDFGTASMYGAGGQKRVPTEFIADFVVPLPSLSEQIEIAAFLDRETAKIDGLIAKQSEFLSTLDEHRRSFINEAVTRGVSPTGAVLPIRSIVTSSIPPNRAMKRVKHVLRGGMSGIQMGPFGSSLRSLPESDTGLPLYGQRNTISGNFEASYRWISKEFYDQSPQYHMVPGDVVLTRKGSLGNCRLVPEGIRPGCFDSDTIRIRFNADMVSVDFMATLLHEAPYIETQIAETKRGAVLSGLNSEVIANLFIAVPPLREQTRILSVLENRLDKTNRIKSACEEQVERLRERRSALINAAMTGQIDVRQRTLSEVAA